MADKNCIFCKIVAGDIPSYKIHENEDFMAILDIAQFTEGHTIALPKKHFDTIWDVQDVGEYFRFVQEVGNSFREKGFRYVDTLSFGRMVLHSHVHIVPHNGDNTDWRKALEVIGRYQQDPVRRLSGEKGTDLIKKYKVK